MRQQFDGFDSDKRRVLNIARQMETKPTDDPPTDGIGSKLPRWIGNVIVFILVIVVVIVVRLVLSELFFNLF